MGWYADPAGSDKERYWDGSRWTRNLRTPPEPPKGRRSHSGVLPEALEPIRRPQSREKPEQRVVQRRSASSAEGSPQRAPEEPQQSPQRNPYDSYRPQRSAMRLDTTTSDGVPLAGWWWRVLSSLIDQIIIWALVSVVWRDQFYAYVTALNRLGSEYSSPTQLLTAIRNDPNILSSAGLTGPASTLLLWSIALQVVYQFGMLAVCSASVGQLIAGLRVVEVGNGLQHRRLRVRRAAVRAVTWGVVEWLNIYLGMLTVLSYLMPLFQRRRQTIHDLVGGTQVVRLSRD